MNISQKFRTLSLLTYAAILPLSALFVCAGCSDDFEPESPESDIQLQFETNVSSDWNFGQSRAADAPASRGALANSVGGSFALYAGIFTGSWDETQNSSNYFYNLECKRRSNGIYSPEYRRYWPAHKETKVKVFAYAPYNLLYAEVSEQSEIGSPKLTYAVPASVKRQQDLLVTSCIATPNEDGLQNLTFSHALSAIRFVAAKDIPEGSVKSISIKGVYSTATTIIGETEWTNHSHPLDYVLEFPEPIEVGTKETANANLTTDENTFILMPQTLPEGASIEIKFIDIVDIERTFSADISGTTWNPGTIVTYAISPNLLYILDVSTGYEYKSMF